MLRKEDIQRIEALLKIQGLAELIAAPEEKPLPIDEKLTAFTEEELTTLKSNSYKDGKKAGVEMEVDAAKQKHGLDFQGKTIDGLLTHYQTKILADAKIEPQEQVKTLTKDLDIVKKENERLQAEVASKATEATRARIDRTLYREVPETILPAEDFIEFARVKGYDFEEVDGKVVVKKGGEVVKDHTATPKAPKDVLSEFAKEAKLAKEEGTPGGRGGNDKTPAGKPMSLKEIKEQFTAQGKSFNGSEFAQAVREAAKDNPDFKME